LDSFAPYLEDTVKKWHVKTEAATKRNKRYKSLNQPLMQQVDQVLHTESAEFLSKVFHFFVFLLS
jgi:hypothetical protein